MSDVAPLRVGFIGLGAMGGPICGHLVTAGNRVVGFDLNRAAMDAAAERGVQQASSVREAASGAALFVVMVQNAAQADAVLFGEHGAVHDLPQGATVWLASTVAPAYAQALQSRLKDVGLRLVDGPVSGGATGAQDGTLTIIVSGEAQALQAAQSAMQACASTIHKVGDSAGAASTVKLVNQLLTASHIALTAEALALGTRAGVDPEILVKVISQSAGTSRQFEKRAPRMVARDHAPQSTINIFLKDLEIALDAARTLKFAVPIAASAHQMFSMAAGAGDGANSDTTILHVYERNGGVDVAAAATASGVAVLLAPTATKLPPDADGAVMVSGSHGGRYPGYALASAGARAVILNDGGAGKDAAGIGSLAYLDALGIAAATVSHASCRIGDAEDMMARGVISHANGPAAACGVVVGQTCRDAAERLRRAPHRQVEPPKLGEARSEVPLHGAVRRIVLLDSAALVTPADAGQIVVTGSHGGLVGGVPAMALRTDAYAAVFNDAGGGADGAGVTRLPALDQRGIAAFVVAADSARIGEAASSYHDGVVSAANDTARCLGAVPGAKASDVLQAWAMDQVY